MALQNTAAWFRHVLPAARFPDWWEFKLPPLLAVGYATAFLTGIPLYQAAAYFLFLLLAIIVGAVYVSLINDITDIEDDLAAGKRNRMVNIRPGVRWLLPLCCVAMGGVFGWLLWPDVLSVALYVAPWVAFSLYSIPPFRFKSRGVLGILCDAAGAHVFPSLLMVSGVTYAAGQPLDGYWFTSVALWSSCYGLRGILFHQFEDRDRDLASDVNTFASKISPGKARLLEQWVFGAEIVSFGVVFAAVFHWMALIALAGYAGLVWLRKKMNGQQPILVLSHGLKSYQILMADYYQFLFPVSLLIHDSFDHQWGWLLVFAHLTLFPKIWINLLKDTYRGRFLFTS